LESSRLYAEETAVDCVPPDPPVDEPAVVADLETIGLDRLYEVL